MLNESTHTKDQTSTETWTLVIAFHSGTLKYQNTIWEQRSTVYSTPCLREKIHQFLGFQLTSSRNKQQALWKQCCESSLNWISAIQLFIMHCNDFVKVLTPHNKQNEILLSKPNEVDWISLFISRDAECIFYTCCMESLPFNFTSSSCIIFLLYSSNSIMTNS